MKQATVFGILIPLVLMMASDARRTWGWAAVGGVLGGVAVYAALCVVVWRKISRAIDRAARERGQL